MANYRAYKPVVKGSGDSTVGLAVGKLIQCTITPNTSDVKLYGDDIVAEQVIAFNNATLSLNTTTVPKAVAGLIYGADSSTEGALKYGDLNCPFVSFGFIAVEMVDGVDAFKVVWLPRVKFNLPTETYDTKGESVSFGTPTITATASQASTGSTWKEEYYFTSASDALSKLNTLANMS